MPDSNSRKSAILSLLNKGGIKSSLSSADVEEIIQLTNNFSFSDLAALTREAALFPIRELGKTHIHDECVDILVTDNCLGPKVVKIQENKIRPLRKVDFLQALKTIRPSVCEEQLSKYLEWNNRFGVTAK
jgi:SpoVK/Ycf46/Vps4 family AAA+-type ATPase